MKMSVALAAMAVVMVAVMVIVAVVAVARRPVGTNAAPADGSDKPAVAVDSVKRVNAPATAADGQGE